MTATEAEPRRAFTEPLRCDDCADETTHEITVWGFGSATSECLECGLVVDLGRF